MRGRWWGGRSQSLLRPRFSWAPAFPLHWRNAGRGASRHPPASTRRHHLQWTLAGAPSCFLHHGGGGCRRLLLRRRGRRRRGRGGHLLPLIRQTALWQDHEWDGSALLLGQRRHGNHLHTPATGAGGGRGAPRTRRHRGVFGSQRRRRRADRELGLIGQRAPGKDSGPLLDEGLHLSHSTPARYPSVQRASD